LLVSLLLRRTLRPVRALTIAARQLGEGDLSQRVPEGARGELGLLSKTFNTMSDRMEKTAKQRRNLMADVSHELRTPLFNIQGHLEAIKDGVFEPDSDTIGIIHQQAEHLTSLVEDVQTLALAESQQLQLNIQPHSITDVLEHRVNEFRSQTESKGISLTVSIEPDIPAIPIDRTRISQVVDNLLQNAISHTPSDGDITIKARKTGNERITISITDTGSGIAGENLPYVFDRFYRTDQARAIDTGGSGLGLAIAKELVEAHGGIIYAENNTDGGSRFVFELPFFINPHQ
jgi:signal transduction histidine kinase